MQEKGENKEGKRMGRRKGEEDRNRDIRETDYGQRKDREIFGFYQWLPGL